MRRTLRNTRLDERVRVKPGALHAEHGAVVAGQDGDQSREAADERASAVAKLGVEAQAVEAGAVERRAKRRCALAMAMADNVEEVAVLAGRGVGPLLPWLLVMY